MCPPRTECKWLIQYGPWEIVTEKNEAGAWAVNRRGQTLREKRTPTLKELLKLCPSQVFIALTVSSFTRLTVNSGVSACVLMVSLGNKKFAALYWFCSFFSKNILKFSVLWNPNAWEMPAHVQISCLCLMLLLPNSSHSWSDVERVHLCAIKNTHLFVTVNGAGCWSLWPGGTTGVPDTMFLKTFSL